MYLYFVSVLLLVAIINGWVSFGIAFILLNEFIENVYKSPLFNVRVGSLTLSSNEPVSSPNILPSTSSNFCICVLSILKLSSYNVTTSKFVDASDEPIIFKLPLTPYCMILDTVENDDDTLFIVVESTDMDDDICTPLPNLIPASVFFTKVISDGIVVPIVVVTKLSPYELLGIPTVDIGLPLESVPMVCSVSIELPLSIIFITVSKLDVTKFSVTCVATLSDVIWAIPLTFNGFSKFQI